MQLGTQCIYLFVLLGKPELGWGQPVSVGHTFRLQLSRRKELWLVAFVHGTMNTETSEGISLSSI